MKRLLLLICILQLLFTNNKGQEFFIHEPTLYQGSYYDFSIASWNSNPTHVISPNGYVTLPSVRDTLVFVDDGIDSLGCDTSLIDLTGKIAICYRGSCEFGFKALMAQNAGAEALIIINSSNNVISMAGGTYGDSINIPVIMIPDYLGNLIKSQIDLGQNFVVSIGDDPPYCVSTYLNDLSILKGDVFRPASFSRNAMLSLDSSEFNIQPGALVRNNGTNNQTGVSLNAQITFNGNIIYNQTSNTFNIDSCEAKLISLPNFYQNSYSVGNYKLNYSVLSSVTDDYPIDNTVEIDFIINDSLFSYCALDSASKEPISFFDGGFDDDGLTHCISFMDSNASRLSPKGLTFSAFSNDSLTGRYIDVNVLQWNQQFVDVYDPNFYFWDFEWLNGGYHIYSTDAQGQNIYVPFDTTQQITLNDSSRYLFCVTSWDQDVSFGIDYNSNYRLNHDSLYKQPIAFSANSGFGYRSPMYERVPSISLYFNCENKIINQTSCNSYSYAGQTYTQSGNYLQINGCDTTFLNLTINNSTTSTIIDTVCGNYELNGQTFPANDTLTSYTQVVPNYLGCDSVITIQVLAYQNYFPLDFQANPTAGNTPLTIIFDNQTPNLSNYNFTWSFGDGSIVQDNGSFVSHTYQSNGTWDVALIAENIFSGCSDTLIKNGYVFSSGGTPCNHSATINQTGPISACLSDSIFLSCNTGPNFTYQWQLNGFPVSGAIDSLFYPTQSGNYNVVVTQNNCPVFSSSVQVNITVITEPVVSTSGTLLPCLGGSVTLSVPNTYSSYNWSSGGTSSSEVISSSGTYFVTVSNATGCEATSPAYTINASFATPPDVCIVGFDALTNYNKVVWEKPISTAIDSFYVYKETNQANIYQKIGGTAYADTAVFSDVSSNPAIKAYRYKLSLVDSCGVESSLGSMHKSMHLTINQGVGTTWNLIWSHYEGFTFPSYNIYRGTSPNNMSLLTTIASNLNSYTDISAPSGQLYYQIEVVSSYTCDPFKSTYNTSRSNVVDNAQAPSIIVQNQNSNINVFPNPTQDQITIDVIGYNGVVNVEVYDLTGKLLKTTKNTTISMGEYAKGIYVCKVNYGDVSEEVRVVRD